jgi:hypothetical protein
MLLGDSKEPDMGRKAISILMLCLLAATGLVGCRGDNAPFRGETPYTGSYAGSFRVPGTNDFGAMTLTISNVALMAGTFENLGTGETGTIRGSTHPDGLFNATFTSDVTGTVTNVSGIMEFGGTRDLLAGDGTWVETGVPSRGFTFDLDRDAASANPLSA